MNESATEGQSADPERDSFRAHLLQLDHWTFLLALGLVLTNVVVESRYLSAGAATLLLVALVYDAAEFYGQQ
jgi:hypothetical protein